MVVFDPEVLHKLESLRKIQRITLQTAQTLKSTIPSSAPISLSNVDIPPLNLPFPNSIISPIMELEVSDHIRMALVRSFTRRVSELQQKCISNYQNACVSGPWLSRSDRNTAFRKIYENLFEERCRFLVESQMPYILEEVAKRQQYLSVHCDKKNTFNHEYTPVLESYFEHNAYPTLPDRLVLARKSMMTARQIEVWFQNHRNRAKKEGVPLKRLSSNIVSTFSFEDLVAKVPHFAIPKRDRSMTIETESSDEEGISDTMNVSETPSLLTEINSERPPYTFPLPYSKKNTVGDPFATKNGTFKFPSLIWQRRPATSSIHSPSIDMDDFSAKFASKLDLRVAPSKTKKSSKITPAKYCTDKWFSNNVTALPDAPHPASIRTHYMPMSSRARIPTDYKHPVWQLTSLKRRRSLTCRLPHILPSWTVPGEIPTLRKTPALPRRAPSTLRSYMPALCSLQASCSRASSSSSISTSDSRSTSMSSSLSMTPVGLSPEVTTPLLLPEQHMQDTPNLAEQSFDLFGDSQHQSMESCPQSRELFNFEMYNKSTSIFEALCIPTLPFIPS